MQLSWYSKTLHLPRLQLWFTLRPLITLTNRIYTKGVFTTTFITASIKCHLLLSKWLSNKIFSCRPLEKITYAYSLVKQKLGLKGIRFATQFATVTKSVDSMWETIFNIYPSHLFSIHALVCKQAKLSYHSNFGNLFFSLISSHFYKDICEVSLFHSH